MSGGPLSPIDAYISRLWVGARWRRVGVVEDAGARACSREGELRLVAVPRGRGGPGESALEAWHPRGRRSYDQQSLKSQLMLR